MFDVTFNLCVCVGGGGGGERARVHVRAPVCECVARFILIIKIIVAYIPSCAHQRPERSHDT